jgi:predicted flap endonuclease-1-like 5' DNA nuclease
MSEFIKRGGFMTNDRSARALLSATLLLAAVLVAMNRAVVSAPLSDWWLPVLLAVLGIAAAVYRPPSRVTPSAETQEERPRIREYLPPVAAQPVAATAAPATPAPVKASAQPPSHTAKTEHADPGKISAKDAPPAPPPDESKEATPKTQPEAQVVMEATANAPQPYEAEKTGGVNPDDADKVAAGKAEETAVAANMTKKASRRVTAKETKDQGVTASADDLTIIDGIGPKTAAALRAAGIDSFQKLANASEDEIMGILRSANVRIVPVGVASWTHQAGYAARKDWNGLNRYNRDRKGGGD